MPAPRRPGHVPIPRRLRRTRRADVPAGTGVVAFPPAGEAAEMGAVRVDAQLTLTPPEADALVREMGQGPSPSSVREAAASAGAAATTRATPARLRSTIEASLGPDLADGWVLVTRLPRALHANESWEVRLVGVKPAGRDRVIAAVRSARLAAPGPSRGDEHVR